jgi:hypothetical protein
MTCAPAVPVRNTKNVAVLRSKFKILELIQLLLEDLRVQIAAFEQKLVEVRASL